MTLSVETLDADVLLLQETRVTQDGLEALGPGRRVGWCLGAGCRPPSGGLAVLARDGRRGARVPVEGRFCAQWLRAVLEANQGKPLHVVLIYGFDSGQPEAAEKNAAVVPGGL